MHSMRGREREYNRRSTQLSTQQSIILRLSYSRDFIESSVIVLSDSYIILTLRVSSGPSSL